MANNFAALYAALTNLRAEVKTLKECLDDPLGTVSKLQLHLDAANKLNEGLDRKFGNLRLQHTELEHFLWSRGELEDQIKVLESSLKEKDEEIARISQQNNELRYPQSPEKIAETIDSADNLAISNQSSIIGKLEKEKSDLSEQLQIAIRERDEKHQKWLTAREDKENMRNVFISNEESRERLLEENGALCEQVAGLKAQRQPAAVSPARNNIRRISSAASVSRPRPSLTRTQERVIATVQHLRDDQLERLESDGAFEAVSIKVPGQGHHWVKGVSLSSVLQVSS
jgi:chromosome segregation ATPase